MFKVREMASMNRSERAKHYLERLLTARNVAVELELIVNEINNLVYTKSREPLSKEDKLLIIEELERLVRDSPYRIDENTGVEHFQKSTTASDNSDILDVISAMKKKVGK